jgi:ApaG protein
MVEQITSGIKISVETNFDGTFFKAQKMHYAFEYQITIYNQSNNVVQLESRQWTILDALNNTLEISGEGVIGKKPIIHPGEYHTYRSGCILKSANGAMYGHYKMINFTTTSPFKVIIPTFKLNAPYLLN